MLEGRRFSTDWTSFGDKLGPVTVRRDLLFVATISAGAAKGRPCRTIKQAMVFRE